MPDLGMSVLWKSWLSYTEVFRFPLRHWQTLFLKSNTALRFWSPSLNVPRLDGHGELCSPLPLTICHIRFTGEPLLTSHRLSLLPSTLLFLFLKAIKHRAAGLGTLGS